MKQIYSAGIVLYIKKDDSLEYLLLHYLSGHWEFPKGKLEPGETKEQAAIRELKEETGLTAELIPGFEETITYNFRSSSGDRVSKTVFLFVGCTDQKQVILSHEHQGYAWLSFPDALRQLSFDNAKEVFKKAQLFLHKK